jgi:hypothetical protein
VKLALVRVANTTQIELLTVPLERLAENRLDDNALTSLRGMLQVAATIPGGLHDHSLFDAALDRLDADTRAGMPRRWSTEFGRIQRS